MYTHCVGKDRCINDAEVCIPQVMPNSDDASRDEKGDFAKQYPDEDFLDAVESLDMAGTSTVAEKVGCSEKTAYHRLKELEKRGLVEGKKPGRDLIWVPGNAEKKVLEAVRDLEVATIQNVVDETGMNEDTVETILQRLENQGDVESDIVPKKEILYWYTTDSNN